MLTVKEVATELNVHTMTILRNLNNGKIKGVKIGHSWRINEDELKRLKSVGM